MVGQRFVQLLDQHPWFEVAAIAASAGSAGKSYEEAVQGRWKLDGPIPDGVKSIVVQDASHVEEVAAGVDFIFCAVDMKKDEIQALEEAYAKAGVPVVSNNSAHRWTPDVPMVIPEINPGHLEVIAAQRERLGTSTGFIAVKPNCSIQSYVPMLHALAEFKPVQVVASTYQAISGAGKNFTDWPGDAGQCHPLHRWRGREERAGAAAHLGQRGEWQGREGQRTADYDTMYPRTGTGGRSGDGIRLVREQAVQGRDFGALEQLQGTSAGARAAECAEAVHHLLHRG